MPITRACLLRCFLAGGLIFSIGLVGAQENARPAPLSSGRVLVEVAAKSGGYMEEARLESVMRSLNIAEYVKFIVIADGLFHIVGVDPEGRDLLIENGLIFRPRVVTGRWFEPWEDDAAVIGRISAEAMGETNLPPGMRHFYTIGSVLRLGADQVPVRVIGLADVPTIGYSGKIILNLAKAQQIYGHPGTISSVVASFADVEQADKVRDDLLQAVANFANLFVYERRPRVEGSQ